MGGSHRYYPFDTVAISPSRSVVSKDPWQVLKLLYRIIHTTNLAAPVSRFHYFMGLACNLSIHRGVPLHFIPPSFCLHWPMAAERIVHHLSNSPKQLDWDIFNPWGFSLHTRFRVSVSLPGEPPLYESSIHSLMSPYPWGFCLLRPFPCAPTVRSLVEHLSSFPALRCLMPLRGMASSQAVTLSCCQSMHLHELSISPTWE